MTSSRDELIRIGEELRRTFAEERDAIARLDHARLATIATTKRDLVDQLAHVDRTNLDPDVRELFVSVRAEAHATAMLASTAGAAVRLLLGYDATPSYDRRARPVTTGTSRTLATY